MAVPGGLPPSRSLLHGRVVEIPDRRFREPCRMGGAADGARHVRQGAGQPDGDRYPYDPLPLYARAIRPVDRAGGYGAQARRSAHRAWRLQRDSVIASAEHLRTEKQPASAGWLAPDLA